MVIIPSLQVHRVGVYQGPNVKTKKKYNPKTPAMTPKMKPPKNLPTINPQTPHAPAAIEYSKASDRGRRVLECGVMAKNEDKDQREKRKEDKEQETHTRAEFFSNLKKVVKKRARPSRSDSETR
jgi:hypothetical protein